MRPATNRVPVLARILPCTLALGCAALLGLPTSASASTILIFGQQSPTDIVSATFSGDNATLVTGPATAPASIPITITQIGNETVPPGTLPTAFETFVPDLTSSTPQVGDEKRGFSGEIIISSDPGGAGLNILTASFSGGTLTGSALSLTVPDNNVTFTTQEQDIINAIGGTSATGSLTIGLNGITPSQLPGAPFTSFTAQNSGLFATTLVIPEPTSIVMAGLGLLGVLGYGSLRYKSSKA